jgi:hypothetical protein
MPQTVVELCGSLRAGECTAVEVAHDLLDRIE